MRFITYLTWGFVVVSVVCVAAYTAVAAEYGWEAEDFTTSEGGFLGVFDVPFTATDFDEVEYTIEEAYGDQFIGSTKNSVGRIAGAMGGLFIVTYAIELPAGGDWYFWGRGIGPKDWDNSFFWIIDEAPSIGGAGMNIWEFNELTGQSNNFPFGNPPPKEVTYGWAWYRISSRLGPFEGGGDEAVPIELSAGSHAFHLAGREDGAYMDVLFATTESDFDANATAPSEATIQPLAVAPGGKLTTTWGSMKSRI